MKKILTLVLCLALSAFFFLPVIAEEDDRGNTEYDRVIDLADVLTDSEEEELLARADKLARDDEISYIIMTNDDNEGMSSEEYAMELYYYGDYDVGDGNGAIILYLSLDPSDRAWYYIPVDSYEKIFDDETREKMNDDIEADMRNGDYYEAFLSSIELVKDQYKNHGKLSVTDFLICLAVAVVIGLVVGGMRLTSCRKAMRVVAPVDAREYLVSDSFRLRDKKTYYLYSTVTRTEKQKSGGSSGGSSHGHSYSSSRRSL